MLWSTRKTKFQNRLEQEGKQRERERIFKDTKAPNGRWLAHQPNYPGPQSAKPRPTCALVHSRHTQEFSKHGSIMQACASACLNAGKENDNLYVCCGRQGKQSSKIDSNKKGSKRNSSSSPTTTPYTAFSYVGAASSRVSERERGGRKGGRLCPSAC